MSAPAHQSAGIHLIADLQGIEAARLTDTDVIAGVLRQAAMEAGATILFSHFHAFGPGQGITGVLLLAESHISIHTWPEHGFAAVDVFMCGDSRPERALEIVAAALAPASSAVKSIARGAC